MKLPQTGRCECGHVAYEVTQLPLATVVCHCINCQKLSATAFGISVMVPKPGFRLTSGELKTWTRTAASGDTVSCHFCPECGNRIYHDSPGQPDIVRLKPGTLDDTSIIKPEVQVWTKRAQPWVKIPGDLPSFDTQPDLSELRKGILPKSTGPID